MKRFKKVKKTKRDLATIGREVLKEQKTENVLAVAGFAIDEQVQYYTNGWHVGHIRELPVRGLNRGRARIEHLTTGRKVWVDGSGLRRIECL